MKTTRFTESQIVKALKDYKGGKKVVALCFKLGITQNNLYDWMKKYAAIDGEQLRRLKELEEEN